MQYPTTMTCLPQLPPTQPTPKLPVLLTSAATQRHGKPANVSAKHWLELPRAIAFSPIDLLTRHQSPLTKEQSSHRLHQQQRINVPISAGQTEPPQSPLPLSKTTEAPPFSSGCLVTPFDQMVSTADRLPPEDASFMRLRSPSSSTKQPSVANDGPLSYVPPTTCQRQNNNTSFQHSPLSNLIQQT